VADEVKCSRWATATERTAHSRVLCPPTVLPEYSDNSDAMAGQMAIEQKVMNPLAVTRSGRDDLRLTFTGGRGTGRQAAREVERSVLQIEGHVYPNDRSDTELATRPMGRRGRP
jgi:hypothetical protein